MPFSKWPPQYRKNSTAPDNFQVQRVTRHDYNLTIMKSPKPATDNRFKNKLKATFEIEQC
jgi:hypothetical protein